MAQRTTNFSSSRPGSLLEQAYDGLGNLPGVIPLAQRGDGAAANLSKGCAEQLGGGPCQSDLCVNAFA